MRVYYSNSGKILTTWSEKSKSSWPEDGDENTLDQSYSVLVIDEGFNRKLCVLLQSNNRPYPMGTPDRFSINGSGQLINNDTQQIVTISPNPQKEAYKLSTLYGMTQAQLEAYIDANVTNIATARTFLKKLSAVVLWLVKQSKLAE